jgi:hypothetical protein
MSEFLAHSPCSLYSKIKKSAEERKSFPFETGNNRKILLPCQNVTEQFVGRRPFDRTSFDQITSFTHSSTKRHLIESSFLHNFFYKNSLTELFSTKNVILLEKV